MSNLFANIPVPANGPGAAVDTSMMGATKTFVVGGPFKGSVTLEFSNDTLGTLWAPVPNGSFVGNPGRVTIDLATRWVRANTTSYGGGANADVGAPDINNTNKFVQVTAAPVDISEFPAFKTVIATAGNIEVSEDGVSWSQAFSFRNQEAQSAVVIGQFARLTGGGIAWMGASETGDGGAGATDAAPVMPIVFRPGDPAGSRDNVYVTWAETYAALQSVQDRGQVYLEFDDEFAPSCVIPAGVWSMDNVIWTCSTNRIGPTNTIVDLTDGASFVFDDPNPSMLFVGYGLAIRCNRLGPVAPFVGVNLVVNGGGTRFFNDNPLALPMIETNGAFNFFVLLGILTSPGGVGEDPSVPSPAPVIDVKGGFLLFEGGAGYVVDNAITDTVGGGFVLGLVVDDSHNGEPFLGSFDFPALIAGGGFIQIVPLHRDRHFVDPFIDSQLPITDAGYNQLLRIDTTLTPVTVNAPSANPAAGERFVVKDIGGNAAVNNITVVPKLGQTVESPTITTNFGCKTWVSDGIGNWLLIAAV